VERVEQRLAERGQARHRVRHGLDAVLRADDEQVLDPHDVVVEAPRDVHDRREQVAHGHGPALRVEALQRHEGRLAVTHVRSISFRRTPR
jgi:hypothetical protein